MTKNKSVDKHSKSNSQLVKKELTEEIAALREAKSEALIASGRQTAYIKDRVYKYRKEWWDEWQKMLRSEDSAERKTALIEYNKLQGRILPTQLVGNTGQQVQINIVGMGVDSPDVVEDETVEGEIVK